SHSLHDALPISCTVSKDVIAIPFLTTENEITVTIAGIKAINESITICGTPSGIVIVIFLLTKNLKILIVMILTIIATMTPLAPKNSKSNKEVPSTAVVLMGVKSR